MSAASCNFSNEVSIGGGGRDGVGGAVAWWWRCGSPRFVLGADASKGGKRIAWRSSAPADIAPKASAPAAFALAASASAASGAFSAPAPHARQCAAISAQAASLAATRQALLHCAMAAPMGAASGAVSLNQPDAATGALASVQQVLRDAKVDHIGWHTVLNNHASTRPKAHGGPLCVSLKACTEFEPRGSMVLCRIVLPNSYESDDGKMVTAEAIATEKQAADDDACFAIFATLCADSDGLRKVVFRPAHWKVSIDALVQEIGRIVEPSAIHQPLAVQQRAPASGGVVAGTLRDTPPENLARASDLIRLCLRAHGGSFAPHEISHKKIVQLAGPQEKVHAQLEALIPKGTLRQFIENHPEFEVKQTKDRGKHITWRSGLQRTWGLQPLAERPPQPLARTHPDPTDVAPAASASAASGAHSKGPPPEPPCFPPFGWVRSKSSGRLVPDPAFAPASFAGAASGAYSQAAHPKPRPPRLTDPQPPAQITSTVHDTPSGVEVKVVRSYYDSDVDFWNAVLY